MEKVKARVVAHPSPRGERASTRSPTDSVSPVDTCVQPLREERRSFLDGRFGRCAGCGLVVVFCEVCSSVHARCSGCAERPRLETHRSIALTADEASQFTTLATTLAPVSFATCAPDAPYVIALTSRKTPDSGSSTAQYQDSRNACTIGIDRAPFADLAPMKSFFERVLAAHPAS